MKKFFVVVLVIGLLSCLVCVGVSADELIRTVDVNDSGPSRSVSPSFSYSYLTFISPPYSHPSSNIGITSSGHYSYDGEFVRFTSLTVSSSAGDSILYAFGDVTHGLILSNGELNSLWDGIVYFDSPTVLSSSFVDWYNSFGSFDHASFIGVNSAISYSGQVLGFITSTPGILALVGLSVALAIIPFAVGKVKELIKGY